MLTYNCRRIVSQGGERRFSGRQRRSVTIVIGHASGGKPDPVGRLQIHMRTDLRPPKHPVNLADPAVVISGSPMAANDALPSLEPNSESGTEPLLTKDPL